MVRHVDIFWVCYLENVCFEWSIMKSTLPPADLLQAVNLSKAEVVKRAIRQSCNTERRLDLEQPDGTGLTLLMRAVQKGES